MEDVDAVVRESARICSLAQIQYVDVDAGGVRDVGEDNCVSRDKLWSVCRCK